MSLGRYAINENYSLDLYLININKFEGDPELERHGSLKDVQNVEKTFNKLGFSVYSYSDLTSNEMKKLFADVGNKDHSKTNLVFFVIMSHGDIDVKTNHDLILCSDNRPVKLADLIQPVKECVSLRGKPKVIFVQACRGDTEFSPQIENKNSSKKNVINNLVTDQSPSNVAFQSQDMFLNNMNPKKNADNYSDYLIFYGTTKNFVALRHEENGSFFIQTLCECFEIYSKNHNVDSILQKVIEELKSNTNQVAQIMEKTLTKDLYINSVSDIFLY